MTDPLLELRVQAIAYEADGIFSFDLRAPDRGDLLPFTAGAHIDICINRELERSYSLINCQNERHRYVIAVNRDAASRGGSSFMCDTLRPGHLISVRPPSNTFPLVEDADHSVFIGGGIGVTPLLGMIRRMEAIDGSWTLYYSARTREKTAFLDEFMALEDARRGRVHINFDHEPGQTMFDLRSIVATAPAGAHIYCCGPTGMLQAFETAVVGQPEDKVHTEYFSPVQEAARGGFTVELARTKKTLFIPPEKSILETLLENGHRVGYSCSEGVCGTCETRVLDGIPDHRDNVLSAREKAKNKSMMICCSGAKTERLVLDL